MVQDEIIKVTVIIPVYNVEPYIERCCRSLFEQNLSCVEYIFIDDCSTDESVNVIKGLCIDYQQVFIKDNKHVRIESMLKNSGQAAVRNYGISIANGQYIIHCDSDDWIDKNMLSILYNRAISSDSDIVICDYVLTDGLALNQTIKCCRTCDKKSFFYDLLFQKSSWALWNKLIKKTLYNKINFFPKDDVGEDMLIICQLAWMAHNISYIPRPLYFYYIRSSSTMATQSLQSSIDKYYKLKNNTSQLISFLRSCELGSIEKCITSSLTFNETLFLNPFIRVKNVFDLWNSSISYPLLLLVCPQIKIKYKLLYIAIKLRVYSFSINLKKLLYEQNR